MKYDVVIVGGAVAGAALACALARYNYKVLVIDRRKELGSMNRGDGLQPRTLEILEQWGVLHQLKKLAHVKSYGIELHHRFYKTLLCIDLKPLTDHPFNYVMNIPHRDIEHGLLEWANMHEHINVLRGSSFEQFIYDEQGNITSIQVKIGKALTIYDASIIVAADGGQSSIRKQLNIDTDRFAYNHELVVLHMHRPAIFKDDLRTQVHLHRDGAVVLIPLPDQQMRITIVVPKGEASKWRSYSDNELMQQLSERVPSLKGASFHREGEHIYKMIRMHAHQYYSNNIALIGDAVHQTHASSGQGMNMAIQDADVLCSSIIKSLQGQLSLSDALAEYEQTRKPINEDILLRSNFMSSVVYTPNPLLHICKITGMYLLRLIPGLRQKISRKIAVGISGVQQKDATST